MLVRSESDSCNLAASQTGMSVARIVRAFSRMGSSSITKRREFTSAALTCSSSTSCGMWSGENRSSSRSEEGSRGDAWSSPLPSVVALGSLCGRVEWGSAI